LQLQLAWQFRSESEGVWGMNKVNRGAIARSLLAAVVGTAAVAGSAVAPAMAQAASTRAFAIPAQPLVSALARFTETSGVQFFFDAAIARNIQSPGVSGSLTPEAALARLLDGTGLTYRFTNPTTVTLVETPKAGSAAVLPTISVQGARTPPPQAEIGNLPPAYAGGQVARGGKLGILGNRDMMDTPFNQTSYTQQIIQNQQAATLADVLENDPAVRANFPAGSGIDQFNIRGFQSGNQDIAFGGLYGIAPTSNGMMAVESIERVEVLKGASALLNGMAPFGSVGGTINIVPKRAGDTPLLDVTPSYSSDGQFGGHVDVGRRFGADNAFGARFNAAYRDGDTAIDRQSQEMGVLSAGLDYRGDVLRLSADLGYQDHYTTAMRRPVTFSAGVLVPSAPDASSNYAQSWNFSENKNTYGALRGEYDLADQLTAFAAVGGSIRHGRSISENSNVSSAAGTIDAGNAALQANREEAQTIEAGLRGQFTSGPVRHEMSAANTIFWKETGLAFQQVAIGSTNLYSFVELPKPTLPGMPDPEDTVVQARQQLTSFVVADTMSILEDRIQLTLGARRQRVNADNFNFTTGVRTSSYDKMVVSPAAGLVVKPVEALSLYANHIQGLSQGSTGPTTGVSNPGEVLPPFETKQQEVGAKYDFGRLALTLAAFQLSRPSAYTENGVFGAHGEQQHRGLEFSAFGELTETLRLLGGMTYIDSELTKTQNGLNQGNKGVAVPDFQANIGLEWDTPYIRGLTLSGRMVYTSSQYLNAANTQELPDWTRFDVGARYVFETRGTPIAIRANILNLLDENYWASAASFGAAGVGMSRTFLLSTTFSF
jgi:iron complex outermembrane receptor protein